MSYLFNNSLLIDCVGFVPDSCFCSPPLTQRQSLADKEFRVVLDLMYCTSAAFMQGYYSTLMSYLDWKYMYTLYIHVHTVQLYFLNHNNPWLVSKQSAEEFLLPEGVLWGGHGGDQGVVTGVCVAVRHQVGRCLWNLERKVVVRVRVDQEQFNRQ